MKKIIIYKDHHCTVQRQEKKSKEHAQPISRQKEKRNGLQCRRERCSGREYASIKTQLPYDEEFRGIAHLPTSIAIRDMRGGHEFRGGRERLVDRYQNPICNGK